MKALFFTTSLFFTLSTMAVDETQICKQLEDKAWTNCAESMCKDTIESDGETATPEKIKKCLKSGDGDLNEGAQICVYDGGELDTLIKDYNSKNPNATVNCKDEE